MSKKNYLDVYFYEKWESKSIGNFVLYENIFEYDLKITDGCTKPPEYLSEAELINLMDKNGIGTDATIHEHIQKIQDRSYVKKINSKFHPLPLGESLIQGYEIFGLEFSKPKLRSELESNLKNIEKGLVKSCEVVKKQIDIYRSIFRIMKSRIDEFVNVFKHLENKKNTLDTQNKPHRGKTNAIRPIENTANTGEYRDTKNKDTEKKHKALSSKQKKSTKREQRIENSEGSELNTPSGLKSSNLKCGCKQVAKMCKVIKNNNNNGRIFYACGNFPRKCDFFLWENDLANYSAEVYREDEVTDVKCHCGYETKSLVAHTESNKGKVYFKCKKVYKPCSFFKWKE